MADDHILIKVRESPCIYIEMRFDDGSVVTVSGQQAADTWAAMYDYAAKVIQDKERGDA